MFWTLALINTIENAPFPCNKTKLIDYAERSGAPLTVIENLRELEDDGDEYEVLEDLYGQICLLITKTSVGIG